MSWAEAEGAAVIPVRRRDQRLRRGRAAGGGAAVGLARPAAAGPGAGGRSRPRWRRGSRPARPGRGLEDQLREHGLTLRHFPQSFEYSTLGGWVATRAGGHFATLETHIDDLVESVRAITPRGTWESRRLPASGAGPSPDRLLIGSEGILGVIAEAWVRVRPRPEYKASAGVDFDDFGVAAGAVRAIAQSGLHPANCRLLDAARGGADRRRRRQRQSPDPRLRVRPPSCGPLDGPGPGDRPRPRRHPGRGPHLDGPKPATGDAVGRAWRGAFLLAPYLRDTFVACGVLSETFETAITWDRFEEFHATVMETARRAVAEVSGVAADGPGAPRVSCRFTHVYPDGVAPYFTVLAPAVRGGEVEQWDEIKAAVSEALIDAGGTITHHHAVGRDHRPWYDRQRPRPLRRRPPRRQGRARSCGDAESRRVDRSLITFYMCPPGTRTTSSGQTIHGARTRSRAVANCAKTAGGRWR